jgi:predicted DNA-binding transcriptional regulator AlpA
MSLNFWFEHTIDAYLTAAAKGTDWRKACAAAEQATANVPRRVLTQKDLKQKGLKFSRQHIARKIANGTFPAPFKLPECFGGT